MDALVSDGFPQKDNAEALNSPKRAGLEACAKLSAPLPIQERILRQPNLLEQIKNGEPTLVDIAPEGGYAHAFHVRLTGSKQTQENTRLQMARYFCDHPQSGFAMRMRGADIKGFIFTGGEQGSDLVNSAKRLKEVLETFGGEPVDVPEFIMVVSGLRELQVCITSTGANQTVYDAAQSSGLTYLSWAVNELYSNDDLLKQTGRSLIVATETLYRLNQVAKEDNSVIEPEKAFANDPVKVAKGGKSTVNFYLYPVQGGTGFIENMPSQLTDYSQMSVDDLQILDGLGINGLPKGTALEQLIGDENWPEIVEKQGYLEVKLNGAHTAIKLDYSGLSKLVSNNVDPGVFMMELFQRMAGSIDRNMNKRGYFMGMEGDALLVFLPQGELSPSELYGELLPVINDINLTFMTSLRDVAAKHNLENDIAEHNSGLKMIVIDSHTPSTLRYYEGGAFHAQSSLDQYESSAESSASRGGVGAVIVTDDEIIESIDLPLETLKLEEGIYLHRVFTKTPLEQSFDMSINGIKDPNIVEEIKSSLESLNDGIRRKTISDIDCDKIPNNTLSLAKILAVINSSIGTDEVKLDEAFDLIQKNFSALSSEWIQTAWQNVHDNETLPEGYPPELPALYKSFTAYLTLQKLKQN